MSRLPFIYSLIHHPKKLFLTDAVGAILTSFILAAILYPLNQYFGMPAPVLTLLAGIAAAFAMYSFCCHRFLLKNWRPFLQIICFANVAYCCLSAGLVIAYFNRLTIIGVVYFLAEIIIILCLVTIELKAITFLKQRSEGR
jgi:hypothetical protein